MTQEVKQRRVKCAYRPENARFLLECDFSKQYAHYYRKRLEKAKPMLEFNAKSKWGTTIPIYSLGELAASSSDSTTNCIIIGTVFKKMKLQPDVIEELCKGDFHLKCEPYLGHYTSPDDKLILEDPDENIALTGSINPNIFVTGIVVALLGSPTDDGSQFTVRDICYAEPNKQMLYEAHTLTTLASAEVEQSGPSYLMVVSGLGFHQDMGKNNTLTKALQDLIDFIWGGGKFSEDDRSSRVARILVAGDSLTENRLSVEEESGEQDIATKMKKSRQVKQYSASVQAVKHMDDFFAQLSKTINIDVMPGPSDPSSHLMPQQPFHPCMFPKSCMFTTFNCTTNPHRAFYNENVEILATSGHNIDIISKFSEISDPIDVMKYHLMWGNSAPSAPDNLYSVPYEDEDPHVIDFIPEIYIAGCQDSYRADYYHYNNCDSKASTQDTKTDEIPNKVSKSNGTSRKANDFSKKDRTLLVTIPRFCETYSCVLINLEDLQSQLLTFR